MLPTEQAAAKNAALIGKVVVKAVTIERAARAVMMKDSEASGLDTENGLRHFQACLSSDVRVRVVLRLMDGPWGRFEELTHVLRLFSLAKYVHALL
jgi:hypothetical protein